ncbi:MAG: homoserine kinase [Burkholderiales bacterium]
MAVFTTVTPNEASEWLRPFGVGALTDLQGIASGIENTNYFVTTTQGRYVLTIFEKLTADELPFYLGLMRHLAAHALPCPAPFATSAGQLFILLKGKPAALVSRLAGSSVLAPNAAHCAAVGATLAQMHVAGSDYTTLHENPRGPKWWHATAPKVMPFLDAERQALLTTELAQQASHRSDDLPRGPIHADLFRDNVLFDGLKVGGLIDFYFAGLDAFLYDVAITLNDWCIDLPTGRIDAARASALLTAYAATRPFSGAERAAWPTMLRAAALRFWLSRLYDFYLPRPGELIHAHDPEHFCRVLKLRVAEAASPPLLVKAR